MVSPSRPSKEPFTRSFTSTLPLAYLPLISSARVSLSLEDTTMQNAHIRSLAAALSLSVMLIACGPTTETDREPEDAGDGSGAPIVEDECCQPCPPFIAPNVTPEDRCTSLYSAQQSAVECLSLDSCEPHAEGCSRANPGQEPALWCCPGQGPTGDACSSAACAVGENDSLCQSLYGNGTSAHCVTSTNCQADAAWGTCFTASPTVFCCQ